MNRKLVDDIQALKQKHNAILLSHYYQPPEIQDIADYVGDSLELSRKAKNANNAVIVCCGVWFMAETAKILNPDKTVLIPEPNAGCPMADMVIPEDIQRLRQEYPNAAVVCYVNSSAEIKAHSDICCTSSNAVKIVQSLKEDQIIFVPDQNLGHYVSTQVPDKKIIFHSGYCPTHHRMAPDHVCSARAAHPNATILVHPECPPSVISQADYVGSTAQMIDFVAKSHEKEYIIGTEEGILHHLGKMNPEKRFYVLGDSMICPNMKKNSLEQVFVSLRDMQYRVELSKDIISKATFCLNRMFSVG